jgi:hypothetical protein
MAAALAHDNVPCLAQVVDRVSSVSGDSLAGVTAVWQVWRPPGPVCRLRQPTARRAQPPSSNAEYVTVASSRIRFPLLSSLEPATLHGVAFTAMVPGMLNEVSSVRRAPRRSLCPFAVGDHSCPA